MQETCTVAVAADMIDVFRLANGDAENSFWGNSPDGRASSHMGASMTFLQFPDNNTRLFVACPKEPPQRSARTGS